MLESSSLSLGAWSSVGRIQRVIRDPEAGRRLGLARWLTAPSTGWRGWFDVPALEVVESDDESLLCTLGRSWRPWPWWVVRDAEGRLIGSWRRGLALDPLDRRFAVLGPLAKDGSRHFLDPQGQEVGMLAPTGEDLHLSFAASLQENPFAKMILLAAALLSDASEKRR